MFFIESEIRRLLTINLALKIDDSMYDGTGIAPEIKGVYTSAPVFVDTPYIDSVKVANLYDLSTIVAADISMDRQGKYKADTVLLNPGDALKLKQNKNANGDYILSPLGADSLRIVESSQVTPNTMVVGDFRYGTIYDLEDLTIEMGWINDQFVRNQVTILAEQRLALLIRTGDEAAFRKVTNIATVLANLETP